MTPPHLSPFLLLLLLFFLSLTLVQGAKSFAGVNLYYAAGLSSSQQHSYFSSLRSAGIKVLRVWLDGQDTSSTKNTSITKYPDLEPITIGVYDDTVLKLLDALMVTSRSYGIKLIISIHSFNALLRPDVYGRTYGTGYFYEQSPAISAFDNRIAHVLQHVHVTLGKPWKNLAEYIFAFEAENEAMIGKGADYIAAHQYWQCDRAAKLKELLGNDSGILVMTGGESWMDESLQPDWFSCSSLDVLSIHAYGTGDFSSQKISSYVQKAQKSGKKLLFQEWGACYWDTVNNECSVGKPLNTQTRAENFKSWAGNISGAGVPWMYWEVIPNKDPHYGYDYEIGVNDELWDTFVEVAVATVQYDCAFDYSAYLPS